MTCLAILLLTWVILFIGVLLGVGLIGLGVALIVIAVVLTIALLLFTWRIIYPWLVRMGRWSAQLRNIVFLAVVLAAGGYVLIYVLGRSGIPLPPIFIIILFMVIFFFLLLLGMVVWLVRVWRYGWPLAGNIFWDISFRIVALGWKILVGIPLGIIWFFYHPPLCWLIAALLFYLRRVSAAVAWLLYNPPLRDITAAGLFVTRLIARPIGWLLYNPPIFWLILVGFFILRLIARLISTIIYGVWSWWPFKGVRGMLRKGLTVESKSYQDYKYAQNDGSGAT